MENKSDGVLVEDCHEKEAQSDRIRCRQRYWRKKSASHVGICRGIGVKAALPIHRSRECVDGQEGLAMAIQVTEGGMFKRRDQA